MLSYDYSFKKKEFNYKKIRSHPRVKSADECLLAVNRLKEGPTKINEIICAQKLYSDATFYERNQIFYSYQ